MDDYQPITILDPIQPEVIEHDQLMERVFRKQSIEQNIPINELVLNPNHPSSYSRQ